ncbi:MAG: DUF6455 family protein [Propylenella sp.]
MPQTRAKWPLGGATQWLRNWRDTCADIAELESLPAQELARIAVDVGLDPAGLCALTAKGRHAADLLPRRMQSLGIDPEEIEEREAATTRDLERVCAFCGSKRRCAHDLDAGLAGLPSYCPNADTLRQLKAEESVG